METNKYVWRRMPFLWMAVLLVITLVCALGWLGAGRARDEAQDEARAAAEAAAGARAAAETAAQNAAAAEAAARDAAQALAEAEIAARAAAETQNEAETAAEIAVEAAARAVAPAAAEARQLLRSVLLGEDTLLTEEYGMVSVDDLAPEAANDPPYHIVPYSLAVVDLDRDGIDEVVLGLGNKGNGLNVSTFGYEILHIQDGQVYGIHSVYRGLEDLKEDGTYGFSNGMSGPNGYGTMVFDGTARQDNQFLYYDSVDVPGAPQINFYQNGQSITESEFEAAEETQRAKPDVTWYDFTTENILELFP